MARPEEIFTEDDSNALAKRVMQFKDERMRSERMLDELSEVSSMTAGPRPSLLAYTHPTHSSDAHIMRTNADATELPVTAD